jgi:RNA polymerase sigma-70 factor (ECF subfamily)
MTLAVALGNDTERPVIEAVQRGDHEAFTHWVRRHGSWIRGVIFAVLGERDRVDDVAQQVFTAMWTRIGELKDPDSWRAWVYRLARNAAVDAGRDGSRRRSLHEKLTLVSGQHEAPAPVGELIERERHEMVLAAIRSLPDLYREPFVLRHLEGWSYEQIGQAMNLPVDTVETRLVRARRLLRAALGGKV